MKVICPDCGTVLNETRGSPDKVMYHRKCSLCSLIKEPKDFILDPGRQRIMSNGFHSEKEVWGSPMPKKEKDEISFEMKQYVRLRDNLTCQMCHHMIELHLLHVHHIDGNPAHNESTNLVCLCVACHKKSHGLGRFRRKAWNKLLSFIAKTNDKLYKKVQDFMDSKYYP